MTYIFYTIALLLIAFPGYWSEKGDDKYCPQFSWNQSYIPHFSPESSPLIFHINHFFSQFWFLWVDSISLHSADISWILWYEVAIFLSWYSNKHSFFLFSVINISSSCFSCNRLISSWEGFLEVCSQKQLCWESRAYCLVSVHNRHI